MSDVVIGGVLGLLTALVGVFGPLLIRGQRRATAAATAASGHAERANETVQRGDGDLLAAVRSVGDQQSNVYALYITHERLLSDLNGRVKYLEGILLEATNGRHS